MDLRAAVGIAIRKIRISRAVPQEELGPSQSYVSDVERGMKSPSIEKIDDIATVLGVHPLTLLAYAYVQAGVQPSDLLERIQFELSKLE
jgi:transcriptional regulator with XRE-family HTH domain